MTDTVTDCTTAAVTATVSLDDGWVRVYLTDRLERAEFDALQAALGLTWKRAEACLAGPWSPQIEDTLRDTYGVIIEEDNIDLRQVAADRAARYAASVLGLDPVPMIWLQEGGDGLRVANTTGADRGRLVPSLLIGAPHVGKADERELVFEIGKRMAYLRPERFVTMALGTLPKLEAAFAGAIAASGARLRGHDGQPFEATSDEARRMAQLVRGQVPSAILEQVGDFGAKLSGRVGNGLITGWQSATDHTANRAGFILCGDLETAARVIATENAAQSTLPVKERLRELLAYAVSESYFQVRRHLGVVIRDGAQA